jgi:hypothetical protein
VTRRLAPALALGVLALAGVPRAAAQGVAEEPPVAGTLVRWFSDSEKISVRSLTGNWSCPLPRAAGLQLHFNNERVVVPGIAATPGTAEAVDAITTASRPISGDAFQDFVKVRNEVQGDYDRGPLALSYYVSSERDYLAQQVGGRWSRDLRDQALNLSLGSSWSWDDIQPLADDDTQTGAARKTTLHWNAVLTEVRSPTTLVRYGVEYNVVQGLQHSPYRNVYAGGSVVPERHPDQRQRRDAFVRTSHALPNRSSLKLHYRIYNDDWGVNSHELGSRLSQYLTRGLSVRWEYRWYTQTAAEFFRETYTDPTGVDGYRSGDYRLGPLSSHLFGGALRMDLAALAPTHAWLQRLSLWFDVERYFNSNHYSANVVETGVDFRFP